MDFIPPFDLTQFLTEPWSPWQIDTTLRIVGLAFCVSVSCGLVGVYLIPHSMRGSELDYEAVDTGVPVEEAIGVG